MNMSIAIQAVASLHSPAALRLTSRTTSSTISIPAEKPAPVNSIVATEFQLGTRNARIQLLATGEHSVLCYDAATDYNELLVRQSVQAATEAAESWVKRNF